MPGITPHAPCLTWRAKEATAALIVRTAPADPPGGAWSKRKSCSRTRAIRRLAAVYASTCTACLLFFLCGFRDAEDGTAGRRGPSEVESAAPAGRTYRSANRSQQISTTPTIAFWSRPDRCACGRPHEADIGAHVESLRVSFALLVKRGGKLFAQPRQYEGGTQLATSDNASYSSWEEERERGMCRLGNHREVRDICSPHDARDTQGQDDSRQDGAKNQPWTNQVSPATLR